MSLNISQRKRFLSDDINIYTTCTMYTIVYNKYFVLVRIQDFAQGAAKFSKWKIIQKREFSKSQCFRKEEWMEGRNMI